MGFIFYLNVKLLQIWRCISLVQIQTQKKHFHFKNSHERHITPILNFWHTKTAGQISLMWIRKPLRDITQIDLCLSITLLLRRVKTLKFFDICEIPKLIWLFVRLVYTCWQRRQKRINALMCHHFPLVWIIPNNSFLAISVLHSVLFRVKSLKIHSNVTSTSAFFLNICNPGLEIVSV